MTFLRFCVGRVEAVRDEGLRVLVLGLVRGRERFSEAEEGGGMSEDEEGFGVDPGIREGRGPLSGIRREDAGVGVRCGIIDDGGAALGRGGGGIEEEEGGLVFKGGVCSC